MTLLIVVTLIFPASAVERSDLTPIDMNPIDTENLNALNDLTVRGTVTRYFNERLAFLKGETTEFSTAIPAVQADEIAHRALIAEEGITLVSSVITFEDVHCEGLYADLTVIENITYVDSNNNYVVLVEHHLTVARNDNDVLVITRDAYTNPSSNFTSCTYVPPELENYIPMAVGGSKQCMQDIAEQEVGTVETGTNIVKYGEWYEDMGLGSNGSDWCAIFVMWCAYQCNVPISVIPRGSDSEGLHYAAASIMMQYYVDRDLFYENTNSTVEPRVGDLFFKGTSATSAYHVGIIVGADSTYIYVIDGNCENRVRAHRIQRVGSDYIGFARPAYTTTGHTVNSSAGWDYDSSHHWHICTSCALPADRAAHSLGSWQIDTSEHWRKCSDCNATLNLGSHSYGGWNYNSTYHWKACTSCGYKINHVSHTLGGWVYNSSQHWKACSVCGYKANAGSHTYTAGFCSTCRYNPNISIDKTPGTERSLQ